MPWLWTSVLIAAAAADDSAQGLVRTAWYWQARARSDKAEDAWKQVLQAAPDDADALAATGEFAARAGRLDDARALLSRLLKVNPRHPDVPVLRREIELGTRFSALLGQARKLVHEGRVAAGAQAYRELFGGAGPPGDLALEYYQTIGGTAWTEARDGLRRLTQRAPFERRYQLELGKLLTYREETRREGIALLASLSKDPSVAREAEGAERQAFSWLAPSERDLPLLREWQRSHPRDTQIDALIAQARDSGTVRDGFAALDRGDLGSAERLFRAAGDHPDAKRGLQLVRARRLGDMKQEGFAALQRGDLDSATRLFRTVPDDADARLGLALVDQKQALAAMAAQDFPRARGLLEDAKKLAPQRKDVWEEPLRSVTFWGLLHEAQSAPGDAEAEARLLQAEAVAPPGVRWNADLALGNLYLDRHDARDAERRFRAVLQAMPDQPDALAALDGILVSEQRYEEALAVNDRLQRVAAQRAYRQPWLQAELLRQQAAHSMAAHDLGTARRQLMQAREVEPSDAWVLHDLANVLLQLGDPRQADPVVARLLELAPEEPESRATQARVLAAEGRDAEALQVLNGLRSNDKGLIALRRRLEVQVEVPQVLSLAASGQRAAAAGRLAAMEKRVANDPPLAARIAVAWSKLGDRARALTLMQRAMAKAPAAARGSRLELAAALLSAGEDAQAAQLISGLERDANLSAAERRSLGELRVAIAVRKADSLRARNDAAGALAALAPALSAYPRDPRLLAASARAVEKNDPGRAHALYLQVLRAAPGDLDALRGAADTTADVSEARTLAAEAVRSHPDDARAWELQGRVAERSGDDAGAMAAWRHALGRSTAAVEEGVPQRTSYQIANDMQRVYDRHRPGLQGGFEARERSGESGLSSLTALRQWVEPEISVGYTSKASLRVSEIELFTGAMGAYAAPRFGSGVSAAPGAGAILGTELHAAFEGPLLSAEVGTTPLGFPVFSLLGGVALHGTVGPVSIAVGASRKSIGDSALSWAGATDPSTGLHWGGVVVDQARLDLGLTTGAVSWRAWAEGGRAIGLRVADNLRAAGGASAELAVYDGELGHIAFGPSIAALGWQRNLRFFTLGHGGYFSPQRFVHGGAVLRWRHAGDVRWDVAVEPGYDYYQEAHEAIFPLAPNGSLYAGRDQAGPSLSGNAFVGIALSRDLEIGVTAAIQQAPEFQEVTGGVALRFGGR
ncbi:MAG: BCSC C-terminal domain-containing protein [Myxococcales bacterium]|nr:BCSC C-terminal domain-containing protein [Myxococcales bacterium]